MRRGASCPGSLSSRKPGAGTQHFQAGIQFEGPYLAGGISGKDDPAFAGQRIGGFDPVGGIVIPGYSDYRAQPVFTELFEGLVE